MSRYTISFKDFIAMENIGTYTKFYALLEDRIHIEIATESFVVQSQRFLDSVKVEMINFDHQPDKEEIVTFFLKRYFDNQLVKRFFPTEEDEDDMLDLKTYDARALEKVFDVQKLDNIKDVKDIKEEDDYFVIKDSAGNVMMKIKKV